MMPIAHVAIPIFLAIFVGLPSLFAAFGGVLPDIIDKGLMIAGIIPCGRFAAHSIFFAPMAALATYALFRRKDFGIAILLGCYMHLLLDAGDFFPIFYPLVKYSFDCPPTSVGIGLYEVITETVGAALLALTYVFRSRIAGYGKSLIFRIRTFGKHPSVRTRK
jgi:hypothetical protein